MLALSALAVVLFAVDATLGSGDVWVLTDSDFSSRIANEDMVLVKFYAPWCGHCKKIAPEFEKAATVLKNNDPPIILAEVDCTEGGKDTCSQHGVSGYPTLKAYKRGEKAFDYEGPLDADGIVKHMKSKAGPSSKELKTVEEAQKFLDNSEHSIIGFFSSADDAGNQRYQKLASALTDDFRFAHTFSEAVRQKLSHNNNEVVIYQPKRLVTKLEPDQLVYPGGDGDSVDSLKNWVNNNIHGLAGHRTTTNSDQFKNPLIVVYYEVDYVKNPKGSNYWRNRVMKVAKGLADAGKRITFAVSNANDMSHEISEFGLKFTLDKPVATGRDSADQKFAMEGEFSVEALEKFAKDVLDGKLEPYLKSEPIPQPSSDHVRVVVAKQFNEIVNDPTKDVLIEFYAPWCGHCKSLAPKYEELAEKLKEEKDIVIAKMDATANDVPKPYDVKGFPTIYYVPKGSKNSPKKYEGAREVADFIKYLAKESTDPLVGYTRDGKKSKVKKDKTEL